MTRKPQILLPPPGWRPPAIRESVKIDVVIRQGARCYCNACKTHQHATGAPLLPLRSSRLTRFDHRPPVHEREFLVHLNDTKPSANDQMFIRAVDVEHDRPVTGDDVSRMAKVKRIRDTQTEHERHMADKHLSNLRRRGQ